METAVSADVSDVGMRGEELLDIGGSTGIGREDGDGAAGEEAAAADLEAAAAAAGEAAAASSATLRFRGGFAAAAAAGSTDGDPAATTGEGGSEGDAAAPATPSLERSLPTRAARKEPTAPTQHSDASQSARLACRNLMACRVRVFV